MNIQTTNTPPRQTRIELTTGGAPHLDAGGLFHYEGRIWRAVRVTPSGVTGEWVPNQDVTREELPGIGPLTWGQG
jgi:hypothetical protein